jgi:hypothetical protein
MASVSPPLLPSLTHVHGVLCLSDRCRMNAMLQSAVEKVVISEGVQVAEPAEQVVAQPVEDLSMRATILFEEKGGTVEQTRTNLTMVRTVVDLGQPTMCLLPLYLDVIVARFNLPRYSNLYQAHRGQECVRQVCRPWAKPWAKFWHCNVLLLPLFVMCQSYFFLSHCVQLPSEHLQI